MMIGFASQSLFNNGLALLRKANPLCWNGFAVQNHSIAKDWLCFAKPIRRIDCESRSAVSVFNFPGFRIVLVVVGVRINRLWCPPGGPAALLLLPVDD